MKGIILAGGTGSRLQPLTKVINKHLLPVGRYPMIYYPIHKLLEAGIRDILIITGIGHVGEVAGLLGDGSDLGARFTYRVQQAAGGISQAISLGRDFAKNERVVVLLGDNLFEDSLVPFVNAFSQQSAGAKIMLKHVDEPKRFGIAEVEDGRVISIEEKPEHPKSSLCVTGIYMYDELVFDYIDQIKPSARGEYEVTDLNNIYIENNNLTSDLLSGWWTDAGTPEALLKANQLSSEIKLSFL